MERSLFLELLKPLGHWRIKYKDTKEEVFEAHPTTNLCEVCKHGWEIQIERKYGYKDKAYWRYKCRACKSTWQKNTEKTD